jgi:hypothetical protein
LLRLLGDTKRPAGGLVKKEEAALHPKLTTDIPSRLSEPGKL